MKKLINGALRFKEQSYSAKRSLYQKLANGQSPHTMFITCSDSRIEPHLLTGSEAGDIFVARNAGNIVPPPDIESGEAATLDYAVQVLKVREIVVCGHSHCGAISALYDPSLEQNLPSVARWVSFARAAQRMVPEASDPTLTLQEQISAAIRANVRLQLAHIAAFASVKNLIERGELRLEGWVYELESGGVVSLDQETGKFIPLSKDQLRHPLPQAGAEARSLV